MVDVTLTPGGFRRRPPMGVLPELRLGEGGKVSSVDTPKRREVTGL